MSQLEFTDAEWSSLAAEFCKGFTDEQAGVCRTFCRVRGLMPGKHVLFQLRNSKEWDEQAGAKVPVTKIVFITTIDAARLIALRSKEYGGQDPEVYIYLDADGAPSLESGIPLPQLPLKQGQAALPREPWAVRTTVYRKGFDRPMSSVARFDAYAATYKSADGPQLTEMWSKRGPEQLAKCSEMLSLRKAFPEELGSLHLADELKTEAEDLPVIQRAVTPASVVPLPPPVPAVNQTPAQATDAPRPGELKGNASVYQAAEEIPGQKSRSGSTETGNAIYADKMTPDEVNQHLRVLAQKEETPAPSFAHEVLAATVGEKKVQEYEETLKKPEKRTRKPKEEPRPENGQNQGGITDEDLKNIGTPAPVVDQEAIKKETEEFIEAIDPTPTKEEQHGFTARVRALAAAGAKSEDLKNYILNVGKKSDTKQLTVRDWKQALEQLETAQAEGKLVEVSKAAPLPAF